MCSRSLKRTKYHIEKIKTNMEENIFGRVYVLWLTWRFRSCLRLVPVLHVLHGYIKASEVIFQLPFLLRRVYFLRDRELRVGNVVS